MTAAESKDALKRWKQLCATIQTMSTVNVAETTQDKLKRIDHLRNNYAAFVEYYFPHFCQDKTTGELIKSASFHIQAANKIKTNRELMAVFQWARGHAKSTHMTVMIPMWLKCQKKRTINTMILVSKSEDSANKLLGDVQAELQYNKRYIADFGKQHNAGKWTEGSFTTIDGCYFAALGRGQSPRGLRERENRPDYIVIDDLDDDEMCQNEKRVRLCTDWVKEALFGCFGAEGGRFIMVGNLISKNSVMANICKIANVSVSKVNVLNDKGEPSWPEYWTAERIEARRIFQGYRSFQKEYMNNPITEGTIFKNEWIRWKKVLPLNKYDHLVCYTDPSFKGTTKNDYKACRLWGKVGTELHLITTLVRQCSTAEMVRWLYNLYEEMREYPISYFMEANFLQDTILDDFTREGQIRGYQLPISGDKRKKPDKFQRIEAVSPLWERGFIFYNIDKRNDPDMLAGLEQTLAFEKGTRTHDDAPDADEGAIYFLQKRTRLETFQPKIGVRKKSKNQW